MAPMRRASAAVGDATAVGSTSPGFCGASSSALTRSHPTMPITVAPASNTMSRARFVFFNMSYRPRLGLVLQVETEVDVGRWRARVEVVRDLVRVHAVVLLRIDTGKARPCVDVAESKHEGRAAGRLKQPVEARRQDPRCRQLAELPKL